MAPAILRRNQLDLQSLENDLASVEELKATRFPTLDWEDFNGSLLVHSAWNTLRNQIEVVRFNRRLGGGAFQLQQLLLRVRRSVRADMVKSDKGRSCVRFDGEIRTIPHTSCPAKQPGSELLSVDVSYDASRINGSTSDKCLARHFVSTESVVIEACVIPSKAELAEPRTSSDRTHTLTYLNRRMCA